MKDGLAAPGVVLRAALGGCQVAPSQPVPNAVVLPVGATAPTRSLRMALSDCARFDPFRGAYLDKLATLPEPELSVLARAGGPAHVACLRSVVWDRAPGPF